MLKVIHSTTITIFLYKALLGSSIHKAICVKPINEQALLVEDELMPTGLCYTVNIPRHARVCIANGAKLGWTSNTRKEDERMHHNRQAGDPSTSELLLAGILLTAIFTLVLIVLFT